MEEWRRVEWAKYDVFVSSDGNVKVGERYIIKSDGTSVLLPPYVYSGSKDSSGYLFIRVVGKDGTIRCPKIHRLVAEAFIPNDEPERKTTVNHKNEIKTDNRVENLEWMSLPDNIRYGTGISRRAASRVGKKMSEEQREHLKRVTAGRVPSEKTRRALVAKVSKPVIQYDILTGEPVARYPSCTAAAKAVGGHKQHIIECCKGKLRTSSGYGWKYETDVDEDDAGDVDQPWSSLKPLEKVNGVWRYKEK